MNYKHVIFCFEFTVNLIFGYICHETSNLGLPFDRIYWLVQGGKQLVKVHFRPKDGQPYVGSLPLWVDAKTNSPPYLELELRGEGQFPNIKFDVHECILPPVSVLRVTVSFE